jgi:hypothetical protein
MTKKLLVLVSQSLNAHHLCYLQCTRTLGTPINAAIAIHLWIIALAGSHFLFSGLFSLHSCALGQHHSALILIVTGKN